MRANTCLAFLSVAVGLSLAACAHEVRFATAPPARAAAGLQPPAASAPEPPSGDPPEVTHGRGTIAELEARCAEGHPE